MIPEELYQLVTSGIHDGATHRIKAACDHAGVMYIPKRYVDPIHGLVAKIDIYSQNNIYTIAWRE